MLNLQARIHLHEVELVCVGVKNELNSSSVVIAYSLSSSDCSLSHLGAQLL